MSGAPFLVVFDCDGTLVDSQHIITAAMGEAFDAFGLECPPRGVVLSVVGLSLVEAVSTIAPNLDRERSIAVAERYKSAFAGLRARREIAEPLYDGALEAIRLLDSHDDVVLGIATGKSQRGVAKLLERFDLHGHFVTIQTADDAPSKPHPAMLEQAMADAGALPAGTVMIGDTSFDMDMAANASTHAVGVSWGYHPAADLIAAGAFSVIEHFDDLGGVIAELRRTHETGTV